MRCWRICFSYGVAAEEEGDGYRLTLDGADAACTLTLSLAQGRVAGFTLVFAAVEEPDADGSAIAAALQARAAQEREAQAAAMERVLDAVLRAYDGAGELPQTVRARWCAAYAALQEGETAEDTHGPVTFETYPAGRGTRLCCACSQSSGVFHSFSFFCSFFSFRKRKERTKEKKPYREGG